MSDKVLWTDPTNRWRIVRWGDAVHLQSYVDEASCWAWAYNDDPGLPDGVVEVLIRDQAHRDQEAANAVELTDTARQESRSVIS